MPDTTNSGWATSQPLAGHLSLHVAATSLDDVPFLLEHHEKRIGPAFVASLAYHLGLALVAFIVLRYGANSPAVEAVAAKPNSNIIWLNEPGPGGGGGGGGNKMKAPPRKAELPGKEQITVPVTP